VVSSLDKVVGLVAHTSECVAQFEGPQEVVGFLEVWSDCVDLVDEVFNADDVKFAEVVFDDLVVSDWDALVVHLSISSLEHQFLDALQVGVSPGNVRLDKSEHVKGRLVQLDEDAVVDLTKTQKLESFLHLGADLVDTTDTDDESKFGLGWNVEVVLGFGDSLVSDLVLVHGIVFLGIFLSTFEDYLPLFLQCLLLGNHCGGSLCLHFSLGGELLLEGLWYLVVSHLENQMS